MIKTEELRRGNYIHDSGGNLIVVISIHETSVNESWTGPIGEGVYKLNPGLGEEDIDPIPLTPEWMRRFGFITLDAETDIEVWGVDDDSNGEEFSLNSDGIDTPLPLYFEYDLGYRNVRKEIKHVHQLQNLYFDLVGEELTIKEKV